MKSTRKAKLGSQLALVALALGFFAAPGKAEETKNGTPEAAAVCTSYPEWSCESQTVASPERALARKRHEQKAPKPHPGKVAPVKQLAGDVSVDPDEDMRPERFGP